MALPVETRTATFLLTDLEGSSRLWQEHPEEMAASLRVHDEILRAAIRAAGGTVVKGTGDGVLAIFDRPEAAVTVAVEAQRALLRHTWPPATPIATRVAVHAGSVEVRGGDVFGPPLNRLARLMTIGHGGQILVSGAAMALARDALPPDIEVIDRGEHPLRDLERPEHVFQVVAPGLPREFPALRSNALKANLPAESTSFIGREREAARVRDLVGDHRLVTLVGVGGTGKTRLLLHVAADLVERFNDGVWLVELASVHHAELIAPEIGRALGIPDSPGQPPLEVVTDFLREKRLLLLLDNCEHLVDGVADVVQRLLATCPLLTVGATSREGLGIAGEAIFQVPSLGLPPQPAHASGTTDPAGADGSRADAVAVDAAIAASEAVRLFMDRARAVAPDLQVDGSALVAVGEICRRLDGIPLAIELAAARVNVLSVKEIAQHLDDRFRLLTGGRRAALPRQQTLQALIDWSWDLLTPADQVLLRRLSVFRGGWGLDAASAVVADVGVGPEDARLDALNGISRLADRSLVIVERTETTRYAMLETIRQYARDRLMASGELPEIRTRHLAVFRRLALDAGPNLEGPDLVAWLDRLDGEVENLRAALDWAHETDALAAVEMSVALARYWRHRSIGPEGLDRLRQAIAALDRLPAPPLGAEAQRMALVARLESAAAEATVMTGGDMEQARRWSDDSLRLARLSNDPTAIDWSMITFGIERTFGGERATADAEARASSFLRDAAEAEAWTSLAYMASGVAMWLALQDRSAAEAMLGRSIEAARRSANPDAIAFVELGHGLVMGILRDIDAGRPWFLRAIADYGALRDRRMELISRSELAHALRRSGHLNEAESDSRRTILEWQSLGNRGAIANQLEAFAFIGSARGMARRAAILLGAAERLRQLAGAQMLPHELAEYQEELATIRAGLEPAAFDRAWESGRGLTVEEAVMLARAEPVSPDRSADGTASASAS